MDPRRRSARLAFALLTALLPAACEWSTEPVSLSVQFPQGSVLNEDGSCKVQFAAEAFGYGSAEWRRVTVRQGATVTAEYVDEQTQDFWGDNEIFAGQRQLSTPFQAPDSAQGVEIEVRFRISGPEHVTTLRPDCVAPTT